MVFAHSAQHPEWDARRIDDVVPYCVDTEFDPLYDIGLVSSHG